MFEVARHDQTAAWSPFLPLIEDVSEEQVYMPLFDCSNTLAGLSNSPIACPPVSPELLSTYLDYYLQRGAVMLPRGNGHV